MNDKVIKWKIWVDTGGTFTDCIAINPLHEVKRVKVLSISALRGRILKILEGKKIQISTQWPCNRDIFKDYRFKILGYNHEDSFVNYFDTEKQILHLSHLPDSKNLEGKDFEIFSGEEAPILAARLVTETCLDEPLPPMEMRLGSTRGTNALLEHKGAKTSLLITKGFQDLLAIDTQQRPDIFNLNIIKPKSYYHEVVEVDERLDFNGNIIHELSDVEVSRVLSSLNHSKPEAIAIALMHSYLNPIHEQKLEQALHSAGFDYVSCSSALAPSIKILVRTKTALVNAYLSPIISDYLKEVKQKLNDSPLKVMSSSGGLVGATLFLPKDSLLSGPAGGVVGAARICSLATQSDPDIKKILAFDMGGTSTDVSRFDGNYDYRYETQVGDIKLFNPTLAIETVAAGGGSCCAFDGHKLTVGPESAGARPGPACYGFGGPMTITDVNLLLGRISEEHFGIPINKQKSKEAFQVLKKQIQEERESKYTDEELLLGLLTIANEKMADAIRKISVRKGYDPQEYALLACGGAGGQHACHIAEILGMKKIIVPYDAGLLSAYGMGQAAIERFASQQVLKTLSEVVALDHLCKNLQTKAIQLVQQEGYAKEQIEIRFIKLYLRFKGQESSLEIDYHSGMDIEKAYREKYISLYGHWLDEHIIELESIKVIASTIENTEQYDYKDIEQYQPTSVGKQKGWIVNRWKEFPVYRWEMLQAGAFISGPSLLISKNCTLVIDHHWSMIIDHHQNAILTNNASQTSANIEQPEEVQLELFTNRFGAIAEEMGALLERTSFSVNVKERLDFSCALLDRHGELVVNAPHIPVHLGSLGICVRTVRKSFEMEEGDVVITNHPAYGGSHLPDITLISPVYFEGRLVAYVANRAHHAELGGTRPGSMPTDARTLTEEGVVISPTYLIKKGEAQWQHIRDILSGGDYPSRSVEENIADLNGALASIQFGIQAVKNLCQQYTSAKIHHYMQALKQYASNCLQESLKNIEVGNYHAIEYLDDGTPIAVKMHINKDAVSISFEGSGKRHPTNLNATLAIVNSAVIYVLRLLIKQPIPLNEGIMQIVNLYVPLGSFLNPEFSDDPAQCPAVVGGNTETSQRVVDTLLKALGIVACSQGTMNNLLFGNDHFGYYETIGGGTGAGEGFHGADAVHQHMTNTRITDPEILEFRYPVHIEKFGIRKNSGGEGKWRGGNGIIRQLRFLEKVSLTILSQHRVQAPYGINGGMNGQVGKQFVIDSNGKENVLKGSDQVEMQAGDFLTIETPGGGGYGKA